MHVQLDIFYHLPFIDLILHRHLFLMSVQYKNSCYMKQYPEDPETRKTPWFLVFGRCHVMSGC